MVFDLHNDLFTSGLASDEIRRRQRATPDTVVYAVWTSELDDPEAFMRSCLQSAPKSQLIAVEDLGFATEEDMETVCAQKPLYCGLTHNQANRMAGGALSSGLLTKEGESAIKKLNAAHISVDAAHLNRESFYAVADRAERLMDSHTGIERVCSHPRNLTDEQVRLIIERGGIIGLTAVRDFIGGNTVQAYVRLIDTFVQAFGIAHACIGTDFYGTSPLQGLQTYQDFSCVADGLTRLGYKAADIDKIFYTNAKNYFHIQE